MNETILKAWSSVARNFELQLQKMDNLYLQLSDLTVSHAKGIISDREFEERKKELESDYADLRMHIEKTTSDLAFLKTL